MAEAVSIKLEGMDELVAIFKGINIDIVKDAELHTALEFDNTVRDNIQKEIYDKPESRTYVRSGSAKRGSVIESFNGGTRIRWDSTISPRSVIGVTGGLTKTGARKKSKRRQRGSDENYTPMLNRNSKISKLDTKFFDNSVEKAQEIGDKQLENSLHKFLPQR